MADSLATILHDIFRKDKNLLSFFEYMETLISSTNENVDIIFTKTDGTEEIKNVASIGNMIRRIGNLENNVSEISNLDNISNASIRFPDGSIRKIYVSEQFVQPKDFEVSEITSFSSKSNSMKHLFIDPYLHVKIPISREKYPSYDKCDINKLLMILDTDEKLGVFGASIRNKKLQYDDLVNILEDNGIDFNEDNISIQVSSSEFKHVGEFDVLTIRKKTEAITGTPSDDVSVVYKLNTLFYKDVETNTDIYLKVGDKIFVGDSTSYEVEFVDKSTNHIGIILIKGYEPVSTGVGVIKYFGGTEDPYVEAPINSGEYVSFFVKPQNSDMSLKSNNWGIGYSIYTTDVLNGVSSTSFWQSVEAVANEGLIPATEFIKPSKPLLDPSNFKVVLINGHKSTKTTLDDLKKKFSDKKLFESEVKMIQDDLVNTNKNLNTTPADDNFNKTKYQKQISSLQLKLVNASRTLNSSVNELNSASTELKGYSPKYALQGYSTIIIQPDTKHIIVGYETEYRYLNKDENKDENQSIDVTQDGVTKKSIIPKWVKMPTPKILEKDLDGKWLKEDPSNVDQFNINQITIPFSQNEKLEVRTRAVSEVGYPLNINYSDWSESFIIEFPEEIIDDSDSIIQQSKSDIIYNRIVEYLTERGLDIHNADSTTIGEFFYAHFLRNIGTDELTPENKPIDAQTYINTLRDRILQLENVLTGAGGELRVRLLTGDEDVISTVSNNNTIKVFDEFYKTSVAGLTLKKGAIVEKTYYIEITNVGDGDIEIFPFVTGTKEEKLVQNYSGYAYNLNDYNIYRQYWLAPLTRFDIIDDAEFLASKQLIEPFVELQNFQSSQVKSQLVNSRAKDITLNNDLVIVDVNGKMLPIFSNVGQQPFIWDGSQTLGAVPNGNGGQTDFCVHIEHPSLESTSDYMVNFNDYHVGGAYQTLPLNTVSGTKVYYPEFIINTINSDDTTEQQLAYNIYQTHTSGNSTLLNFPNKSKFGENDRYLIGEKTCGVYMSLGINGDESFVDSKFVNDGVLLSKDKKILIPIIVSSRLTDYYGSGSTGIGNIGGLVGATNAKYIKRMGVDILVKESKLEQQKLFSFDFQYSVQYEKSSIG